VILGEVIIYGTVAPLMQRWRPVLLSVRLLLMLSVFTGFLRAGFYTTYKIIWIWRISDAIRSSGWAGLNRLETAMLWSLRSSQPDFLLGRVMFIDSGECGIQQPLPAMP
jgi:hypothetical protein